MAQKDSIRLLFEEEVSGSKVQSNGEPLGFRFPVPQSSPNNYLTILMHYDEWCKKKVKSHNAPRGYYAGYYTFDHSYHGKITDLIFTPKNQPTDGPSFAEDWFQVHLTDVQPIEDFDGVKTLVMNKPGQQL